jgi:two-component system, cell cycle response regulator DivK
MDMSLPVMDGWEATRQLKASADTQTIPVIALTSHAMAEDRQKALDGMPVATTTIPNQSR